MTEMRALAAGKRRRGGENQVKSDGRWRVAVARRREEAREERRNMGVCCRSAGGENQVKGGG